MSSYATNATGSSSVGKLSEINHFYPTPAEPTRALLNHYANILEGEFFHEASCGDGAICKVLDEYGYSYFATDLIERGHGDDLFAEPGFAHVRGLDFLTIKQSDYPYLLSSHDFSTIQNPPFKFWSEFVEQSHKLEFRFIAMFAKQQVWNSKKRLELFRKHPPKAVHPLTWRIDFDGRGRPTMDCCWCVWGEEVPFSNEPLERPAK